MKYSILLLAAAAVWGAEESTRTIEKSFPLTGANRSLFICAVSGSIKVTATDSNEVRLSVHEKLSGSSRDRLEELKKEVDVVFTQESGAVRAGIKGPWSDADCSQPQNRSRNRNRRDWDGDGMQFSHEFTVSVPRDARLELKNVNGSIQVTGTRGNYAVSTVNGGIQMTDVEGSGEVGTVNGKVQAIYSRNPAADTKYRTVNGKLDLYFQPSLNADFSMKTVNGKVFTDFDMTAIPGPGAAAERDNGMKIIHRRGRLNDMRAGNGGIKIAMETVNGEILIHSLAKGRP